MAVKTECLHGQCGRHSEEWDLAEVEDQRLERTDGVELLGQDFACAKAQQPAHLQQPLIA